MKKIKKIILVSTILVVIVGIVLASIFYVKPAIQDYREKTIKDYREKTIKEWAMYMLNKVLSDVSNCKQIPLEYNNQPVTIVALECLR